VSAKDPNDHRMDHTVVLMFENRSFDNLLGYLYRPGEVRAFEGVRGKELANPLPEGLWKGGRSTLPVQPTTSLAAPYPDPGEEYPHVNTQLFGTVAPPSNRIAEVRDMRAPFNAPGPPTPSPPPMNGFVLDYANAFEVEMGRPATVPELAQILAGYTPEQVPVLTGLARGFACFDHWFCEVPSQTYANRSFFHAASSSGFVLNGEPAGKFALRNDAPTLFEQLESARRTWKVYIDPAQLIPATALIHARRLAPYFAEHFRTIYDFYYDARSGELPDYAFLEPNMFHPHTDMHPHSGARWAEELRLRPPDTVRGGEELLAQVYDAVRTAENEGGSNWRNTLLLVTFDEHGGTFDHVPPPSAVPPDPASPPGEQGFRFDRLGVRIPTLLVSAWTDPGMVVPDTFRSTSLLSTMREWWQLGPPLTGRDSGAPTLLGTLGRATPRTPEEWPVVRPRPLGVLERAEAGFVRALETLDAPIQRLERDLVGDALAWEAARIQTGGPTPGGELTHADAHEHLRRIGTDAFPGVANGRTR
jgi:phospholipase C